VRECEECVGRVVFGVIFGDFWRGDVGVGGCEGCTLGMMCLLLEGRWRSGGGDRDRG
jgi:hypothetical protein